MLVNSNKYLFIYPRAPNTIHFHLYISMFLHDLSILPKNNCYDLIPNHRTLKKLIILFERDGLIYAVSICWKPDTLK